MNHLTHEQLSARLDQALKGRAAEEVERHLASCESCRAALAELVAQEAALRPALTGDPGEAYFENFAARVDDRIRAAGLAGAQGRRRSTGFGRLWGSPRSLAWVGAVATVVVAAGLALLTGRDVRPPDLRDRDIATRVERQAPAGDRRDQAAGGATSSGDGKARTTPPLEVAPPTSQPGARAPRASAERTLAPQAEEQRRFLTGTEPTPTAVDQGTAAPPAAKEAQPGGRGANPARARETRLNEAGEPVPVVRGGRADASRFAAPPPATAEDQANQVRKKLFAEPMAKTEKQVQAAKPAPTTAENKPAQDALAAPGDGKSSGAPGSASALGLVSRAPVAAGESRLCGEVRDPSGRPVAGAQAVLTDLARTAVTDAQGMFCLSAPPGEHPLSVMAVGFGESRQSVQVGGQESAVSVTLAAVPVLESGPKSTWGTARSLFRSGGPSQTIAPAEPRDAYSALPDSVRREVREVQRLDATARTRRSAALYDATASRWEGVLRRVAGGPLEIEARWNLGEARFHAWEAGPNARRADAAIEALTGYAVRAPAGPNRDQAARWLDRVRR